MLYDKLWEIVRPVDWHAMTDEYKALAVGTFVVAAVLIWNRIRILKRTRTIESRLDKIEKEIDILKIQETRRFLTELNVKPAADGDVAALAMSPSTAPPRTTRAGARGEAGSATDTLSRTVFPEN